MYNGYFMDDDGMTAWFKRFAVNAPFKKYGFGALVLVRPPSKREQSSLGKFKPRLQAYVLVGVGLAPGCTWDHSYLVVKLERLVGQQRVSKCCIRRCAEVEFPEVMTLPLKQRLTLSGAIGDASLPEPKTVRS